MIRNCNDIKTEQDQFETEKKFIKKITSQVEKKKKFTREI